MSRVRIVVEWVFGDILEYFFFLDFKRNFKVGFSVVGKMYIICVLLRNVYLCIYGLIIFIFFGVDLFLLEYYFI